VGVTHHCVLWSPDFPLLAPRTITSYRRSTSSDRPAGFCAAPLPPKRKSRATVISLATRLPAQSSSLPESRNGPDQPCSHIWPCSRWGLPSQPVARLLVGSYIKGPRPPPPFHPYPASWAVYFLLHFPCPRPPRRAASDGGRYPPPRPVEPGLSSPRRRSLPGCG
jgi:hypothetical protein